jgi:hypothetical protein
MAEKLRGVDFGIHGFDGEIHIRAAGNLHVVAQVEFESKIVENWKYLVLKDLKQSLRRFFLFCEKMLTQDS